MIGSIGMFRQKTRNIVGLAHELVEKHGGEVRRRWRARGFAGVGRKTANVVLGWRSARRRRVVDTHVLRVSSGSPQPARDAGGSGSGPHAALPESEWICRHTLIFHGRRICAARRPACAPVRSAISAECVSRGRRGRKAPSPRSRERPSRNVPFGAGAPARK